MNTKDISEARNPLLPASVAAMERAAEQARRLALTTRTRIVVWREGQIRYIDPAMPEEPAESCASSVSDVRTPVDFFSLSELP